MMLGGSAGVQTLADFWNDTAVFVDDGIDIGSSFGMHFLSTTWTGNQLDAYFIDNYGEASPVPSR